VQNGQRHWTGISRGGDWGNSFFIQADLDSFNRQAQNLFDMQGRRLMVAEFLTDGAASSRASRAEGER
jgi:hypothetical protein